MAGAGWGEMSLGWQICAGPQGPGELLGTVRVFPACLFVGFVYSSPCRTEVWAGVVRDPQGG